MCYIYFNFKEEGGKLPSYPVFMGIGAYASGKWGGGGLNFEDKPFFTTVMAKVCLLPLYHNVKNHVITHSNINSKIIIENTLLKTITCLNPCN